MELDEFGKMSGDDFSRLISNAVDLMGKEKLDHAAGMVGTSALRGFLGLGLGALKEAMNSGELDTPHGRLARDVCEMGTRAALLLAQFIHGDLDEAELKELCEELDR